MTKCVLIKKALNFLKYKQINIKYSEMYFNKFKKYIT